MLGSFILENARLKYQQHRQRVFNCKIARAGFYSIAKFRAHICNAVMEDRDGYSADCHTANGHPAGCYSLAD
jgi:hypothetical protein